MTEFTLYIKDSTISNKAIVRQKFDGLKDGKYNVTIKKASQRSLPQNAYYWGVAVPLVKEGLIDIGYNEVKTDNDAHEILKHLFLKKKVANEKNGDEITIAGSTVDLSTVDFMNYISEIQQWATQYLSIVIPSPNEQIEIFK